MTKTRVILLGALVAATFISCASPARSTVTTVEGTPVRMADVRTETVAEPIRGSGKLTAKEEMRLSFKVGGMIERIHVSEGTPVRKGQILAALNLAEINSQVRQAQEALDKAERDLSRARTLRADSVVTLEQFQDARTGYEVAQAAFDIARFNQQFAVITAPSDGVIMKKIASENEVITAGTPVLIMSGLSKGWIVTVGVADRDVVRVTRGDSAVVTLDAYSYETLSAAVTEIAATGSPQTGTYEIELAVRAPNLKLISGLGAKAQIFPGNGRVLPVVPVESLVDLDGNHARVFTLDDVGTKVHTVPVTVEFLSGASAVIASGLEGVSRVVTDGAAYLRDGSSVSVVNN